MEKDILLSKFFEQERWEYAINRGVDKDIRKDQLIQLTKPEVRSKMLVMMRTGQYQIAPPHTAKIPKDNGDFRTVYVNEPIDRVVLSIVNDLLFELCPETIHPRCKSYQRGVGCGKVVQEVAQQIKVTDGYIIGWKSDLSKYFDSVPIEYIDKAFDMVEQKYGHSAIIDVVRKYYHSDIYFDEDNNLQSKYQSLKQGCAVAAWLADVVLYHIDEQLSELDGYYVRYSDDTLFVGNDYMKAMQIMTGELEKMQMKLNPKKVQYLERDHWFKFLGFSIKEDAISLSKSRIKTFQKEIEKRTIRNRATSFKRALREINNYLYKGNGKHSWATQILPVVNVKSDINVLNNFVMDCLRAVQTHKTKVGGLGYVSEQSNGCITRGTGRNVKMNRRKTDDDIEGYLSLGCMQNAITTRRAVYNTLVMSL